jgi:hypothetical protein
MYTAASGQIDLYTAKPDGSDLVRVTNTPEIDVLAGWGPHSG